MTKEEREAAIAYIKGYRKLDEDLHNTAPKDSISYYATDKCLKYWDMAIQALSQEPICPSAGVDCKDCLAYEPCEDWCDVPSDEMTLEQARQAVKDLRKKLTEHLEQEPSDTVSRGVFEQVMRERDIAIEQLHELGYELGQKIEPLEVEAAKLQQAYDKGFEDCRQAALNSLIDNTQLEGYDLAEALDAIENKEKLPSVTQKSGHWIEMDGYDGDVYYDCSECGESWTTIEGTPWDNGMKYCPNCGCRMVEPQESEGVE